MVQKRVHIFVNGRVQGVFFRQATKVIAIKNNVTGWVQNLDDGRVEILIEGDDKCVDSVIAWCDCGPANSRVDDIQINNENYLGSFENFEVRY
jgi:acylphosphatase